MEQMPQMPEAEKMPKGSFEKAMADEELARQAAAASGTQTESPMADADDEDLANALGALDEEPGEKN